MRISVVALALSVAFGLVTGGGSAQRSGTQQNLSGTTASSKRMADGKDAREQDPRRLLLSATQLR
jgi:hypothetical protein